MQYLEGMIWYAMWPLLIYVAYRFVLLNLKHFHKMERHEELEALHAKSLESQQTDQT